MILQLLAQRKLKASEYRNSLPNYEMVKQKIQLSDLGMDADDLLAKVADEFKNERINTLDGVKIDFDEGWVHFRKSNTEPIVRVYSEGKSESDARSLADKVMNVIR